MTLEHDSLLTSVDKLLLMKKTLDKYQEVKEKMKECAIELSVVNEAVKKEMAAGFTLQHAKKALARTESVKV